MKTVMNRRGFTPLEVRRQLLTMAPKENRANGTSKRFLTGFTLTELTITIAMSAIIILSIGIALVDSHRGWHWMYNRVHSGVVVDGYVARRTFDAVVRKSSMRGYDLDESGTAIEVYYDETSTMPFSPTRYARFFMAGEELLVVYGEGGFDAEGNWEATSASGPVVLARNVELVRFSVFGASVRMILRLDNGKEEITVTSSATRHNR